MGREEEEEEGGKLTKSLTRSIKKEEKQEIFEYNCCQWSN